MIRDAVLHIGDVDLDFILTRIFAPGGVGSKRHVLVLHQVDDVGEQAAGESSRRGHGEHASAEICQCRSSSAHVR